MAVAEKLSDSRFQIDGSVPLLLAEGVELFDTVLARFDGARFWFDQVDPRADPALSPYLRRELVDLTDPARLSRSGLSEGLRRAYNAVHSRRMIEALRDERQDQGALAQ